nr:MAG TPA: TLR4 regulator and MIR-interacting MSAP [Bacteriophage sp.]
MLVCNNNPPDAPRRVAPADSTKIHRSTCDTCVAIAEEINERMRW